MTHEQDMTRTVVQIFGNEYRLVANANRSQLIQVSHFVHQQMMEIAEANPRLDSQRISVLAAVNIADELFRLKESMLVNGKSIEHQDNHKAAYDQLLLEYQALQVKLSLIIEEKAKQQLHHVPYNDANELGQLEVHRRLSKLQVEHEHLQIEYQKLKNEYSEYTKLVYTHEEDEP